MTENHTGKIVKGIAGFYYVYVEEKGLFECKAKGLFRNEGIKPLVGDNVIIQVIDEAEKRGNVEEILPRKNEIIRPACSNIDMAAVIMAISKPAPKYTLLDKILIFFEYYEIPVIICFNKVDEEDKAVREYILKRYKKSDVKLMFSSARTGGGIDELLEELEGKTSILTGPSGVGKSSILNRICPGASDVGGISKIGRGRHTTRHSEIFNISADTYIMDTPGFTSLDVPAIPKEKLKYYFPEFSPYNGECRFDECVHINEPDCRVKKALENGSINEDRYESYKSLYENIKMRKEY